MLTTHGLWTNHASHVDFFSNNDVKRCVLYSQSFWPFLFIQYVHHNWTYRVIKSNWCAWLNFTVNICRDEYIQNIVTDIFTFLPFSCLQGLIGETLRTCFFSHTSASYCTCSSFQKVEEFIAWWCVHKFYLVVLD